MKSLLIIVFILAALALQWVLGRFTHVAAIVVLPLAWLGLTIHSMTEPHGLTGGTIGAALGGTALLLLAGGHGAERRTARRSSGTTVNPQIG